MIKTGEYRPLTFKDQSVANEVAEKYGLTLNADGTINWPMVAKYQSSVKIPRKPKNKIQKELLQGRRSMRGQYKRNNKVDLNSIIEELESDNIYFEQNKPVYNDQIIST